MDFYYRVLTGIGCATGLGYVLGFLTALWVKKK